MPPTQYPSAHLPGAQQPDSRTAGRTRFVPTVCDGRNEANSFGHSGRVVASPIFHPSFPVKYDRDRHHRRSMRLPGHDYSSAGLYFITTCTSQRLCLFGQIEKGEMYPNELGKIVVGEWLRSKQIRPEFQFHEWVLMPNHFHAMIEIIQPPVGTNATFPDRLAMRPKSISSLMSGFKSITTQRINQARNAPRSPVWQSRFYDHMIRDESGRERIRQYILDNPKTWTQDQLHPETFSDG